MQVFRLLDCINVKEDVVLLLQYRWVIFDKGLNELGEKQNDLTVTIANTYHLLKQGLVLLFLQVQMICRCLQFLLDLLNASVQVIHQVLLLRVLSLLL